MPILILKLIICILIPIFFKCIISNLNIFDNTFNMFILMFCLLCVSIIILLIFISDIFSTIFLLEKQGSKLKYFKNTVIKKGD